MAYDENEVWNKGKIIPGYDLNIWRHDEEGNVIRREAYGNTESDHGWEVDHITPRSKGGTDHISNLRPLQWEANRRRQAHVGR